MDERKDDPNEDPPQEPTKVTTGSPPQEQVPDSAREQDPEPETQD
jgi:hypothetical protein